jgi:hypothetical protein
MPITLQTDELLNPEFHDGFWKCAIGGISYMAPTREQLLKMVQTIYPITDHTLMEQWHRDLVFEPGKYSIS